MMESNQEASSHSILHFLPCFIRLYIMKSLSVPSFMHYIPFTTSQYNKFTWPCIRRALISLQWVGRCRGEFLNLSSMMQFAGISFLFSPFYPILTFLPCCYCPWIIDIATNLIKCHLNPSIHQITWKNDHQSICPSQSLVQALRCIALRKLLP